MTRLFATSFFNFLVLRTFCSDISCAKKKKKEIIHHIINTWYARPKHHTRIDIICTGVLLARIILVVYHSCTRNHRNSERGVRIESGLLSPTRGVRLHAQLVEAVWPIADSRRAATAPRQEMQ